MYNLKKIQYKFIGIFGKIVRIGATLPHPETGSTQLQVMGSKHKFDLTNKLYYKISSSTDCTFKLRLGFCKWINTLSVTLRFCKPSDTIENDSEQIS